MSDENQSIIKKDNKLESTEQPEQTEQKASFKFGKRKTLAEKIKDATEAHEEAVKNIKPEQLPNRIGIILDDSGSTAGECWKSELLALNAILDRSNALDTSYTLYKLNEGLVQSISIDYDTIKSKASASFFGYSTPTNKALRDMLPQNCTRLILISDGESDNDTLALQEAEKYKLAGIKIDTVFVEGKGYYGGFFTSEKAKNFMRLVAATTGGIFMTFDNLANFINAASMLAPAYRGMLEDKKTRLMLGSGE
jgi:hypothetical protein